MIYYSKERCAFYDDEIHEVLPDDAQEITQEKHLELLDALNLGGYINDDLTVIKKPSAAHEWVDGSWVVTDAAKSKLLESAKATKLKQLNAESQACINAAAGLDLVPEFERASWLIQADEARAWSADKSAATPMLDGIAASRGVPADTLKAAALRKTIAYELLVAHFAGQRQALQAKIEAAKTQSALDKIVIQFTPVA